MTPRRAPVRVLWLVALLLALAALGFHTHHRNDLRRLSDLANRIEAGRALSDSQRVIVFVDWAIRNLRMPQIHEVHPWGVRLYYRLNLMHPSAADVVRWGADYRGPCGSYSRVVLSLLRARGVQSRILLLRDDHGESIHTVLEVRIQGRWIVVDPSYGIVYHRADGSFATREDLARTPGLLAAQTRGVKNYDPTFDYDSVTLFNWEKIPVVLPALRSLLVLALGEAEVAGIVRPEIWMWPSEVMALVFLAAAAGCALAAWRAVSRRSRPRTP